MKLVEDSDFTLINADVLQALAEMPDESVDCIVTSPPYFQQRDYGTEGQLGLEESPSAYVARLVEVFAELRRVLAGTGVCFLNLGDSYAQRAHAVTLREEGFKTKDMLGLPWAVAFALRDEGWYLRSEIIWSKANCMPESVTDRPTKSHEHVFMLTKSETYYFDQDAVREPHSGKPAGNAQRKYGTDVGAPGPHAGHAGRSIPWAPAAEPDPDVLTLDGSAGENPRGPDGRRRTKLTVGQHSYEGHAGRHGHERWPNAGGRNLRSVWTFPTENFADAHFAVFPLELPRRCILAGCPAGGVVLDPFAGAGTTSLVARQLGRRSISIELSSSYCEMIQRRLAQLSLLA